MRSLTEYLWFQTNKQREIVNITDKVDDVVKKSKVSEGFVLVSAMHITASIFVNDEESGIKQDLLELLLIKTITIIGQGRLTATRI